MPILHATFLQTYLYRQRTCTQAAQHPGCYLWHLVDKFWNGSLTVCFSTCGAWTCNLMQVFTGLSESTVLLPLFVVASARRPPTLINFEMLRSTELVCLTVHIEVQDARVLSSTKSLLAHPSRRPRLPRNVQPSLHLGAHGFLMWCEGSAVLCSNVPLHICQHTSRSYFLSDLTALTAVITTVAPYCS